MRELQWRWRTGGREGVKRAKEREVWRARVAPAFSRKYNERSRHGLSCQTKSGFLVSR